MTNAMCMLCFACLLDRYHWAGQSVLTFSILNSKSMAATISNIYKQISKNLHIQVKSQQKHRHIPKPKPQSDTHTHHTHTKCTKSNGSQWNCVCVFVDWPIQVNHRHQIYLISWCSHLQSAPTPFNSIKCTRCAPAYTPFIQIEKAPMRGEQSRAKQTKSKACKIQTERRKHGAATPTQNEWIKWKKNTPQIEVDREHCLHK